MQQAEDGRLRVVAPGDRDAKASGDADGMPARPGELPSPGSYIRQQRELRGMSVAELASATKIPRSSVEMLEEDRYEALPGPVFVKGFLRCCARSLGMDPDEVMELLYERERAQLQARKRERPANPPTTDRSGGEAPVPRMPPKVRRSAAPARSFGFGDLLSKAPSISLLLWVLIAILVAMVMAAAFNLMGQGPSGPT